LSLVALSVFEAGPPLLWGAPLPQPEGPQPDCPFCPTATPGTPSERAKLKRAPMLSPFKLHFKDSLLISTPPI
ncbi:MAG: hypothetical protein RMJ67_09250, partial [Elusimicrobiota bacterium]|nr:hypothetical protein [Endomicrobiia bacterium]MDW8166682.1 hypothetical protein [Elusimicrobiota bacterium]